MNRKSGFPFAAFLFVPAVAVLFIASALGTTPEETIESDPDAPTQTAAAYLAERQAIEGELAALDETLAGASDEQWRNAFLAWHELNSARFREQELRVELMRREEPVGNPMDFPEEPLSLEIPQALRSDLEARRAIDAELRALQWQLHQATPEQRRDGLAAWHQQNALRIAQADAQLMLSLPTPARIFPTTPETAPNSPRPDASPAEREMLAEQEAIDHELRELQATLADAAPEARRAALHAWHEANAARLESQAARQRALANEDGR